ncbi:MAG: hypothetical protein CMJ18_25035 [Phycisphaeraceae bacterium]|nr:hypothetical protein [Phycisphaeraceae bacterium]
MPASAVMHPPEGTLTEAQTHGGGHEKSESRKSKVKAFDQIWTACGPTAPPPRLFDLPTFDLRPSDLEP